MTPCALTGIEVGKSGPLFWCTVHNAWQGECALPKVPDSDSRWQGGYQDGEIDDDLRSAHRGYLNGWLAGYSETTQCSTEETSAALVAAMMRANHEANWPASGIETLNVMRDLTTVCGIEAAGVLLRKAHREDPALCPLDIVLRVEGIVDEYQRKTKPYVTAVRKSDLRREMFRKDMIRMGKQYLP